MAFNLWNNTCTENHIIDLNNDTNTNSYNDLDALPEQNIELFGNDNPSFDTFDSFIGQDLIQDNSNNENSSNTLLEKNTEDSGDIINKFNKRIAGVYDEHLKNITFDVYNERIKATDKEILAWILSTEQTNESNEDGSKYRRRSRRFSNLLQNVQMSTSTLGLTLSLGEEMKDALVPDGKTVARFPPLWKQTLAATAPILLIFISGITTGYSAILLPQLKKDNVIIPIDVTTSSWIASIAAVSMAPGCIVAGWLFEMFGRRKSLYICCLPLLIGWICIACSYNLTLMLIGRFITGFISGLSGPLVPVYIGETTDPKYRGFFLAAVSLAIAFGILVVHIIGTFVKWQVTAWICCAFPILCFVLITLIPESPIWLISKGRTEEGVKSFYWLRGYGDEAKAEIKAILESKRATDNLPKTSFKEKIINIKSPELMKPLVIMITFFCVCQFSGVNAVAFYSIEIVKRSIGKGMDHYLVMLIIDLLRFVMSLIACVICQRFGRRPLCFISGISTACSMFGLSMFRFWNPEDMAWVPLLCLLFYICAISIGLVPLPWIMCGEIFQTNVRGLGSGISSATNYLALFAVVKTAPEMMSHLGETWTFLFYGTVALGGTIVMYFILPETKDKSLQEIEENFRDCKKEPNV